MMLSKIYNWFTEGFDTLALKEAKALLDQLNQRSISTPEEKNGKWGVVQASSGSTDQ
jgi:hypothetical protein